MRVKDDTKKTAIMNATISLSNEIGFSNVSMSKIAKRAGVSAATLYVYYESKEDMFCNVYKEVKIQMSHECGKNVCKDDTVEQSVRKICENLLLYMQEHTEEFLFIEQSANSPFATEEVLNEIELHNKETVSIFERGIKEGILKPASPALLIGFCYYPIQQIFKECKKPGSVLSDVDFSTVFQMCWDAIKN